MNFVRYKPEMLSSICFYTFPKMLINNDSFNKISSDAKILYMIMQNRVSLSIENNWVDKNNEVYIYLTIEEACEILNCSHMTAKKTIKQLKNIGLIQSIKQGQNKPNRIYVNTIIQLDEQTNNSSLKGKDLAIEQTNNSSLKSKNLATSNNNISNNNRDIISNSYSIGANKQYIKKYIKAINPLASTIELQMLSTYEDEVEPELIEIAIEEAILNNVFKLNYIKAILNNCIKSDIKTAQQYRNMKQLRERKTKENEFNEQNKRNTTTTNDKPTAEDFRRIIEQNQRKASEKQ